MPDIYTVSLTTHARKQMQDIMHYISVELQAPDAARLLLDKLEKELSSLSQLPHRIVLTAEEPWHSYGIHKMMFKNFLIYFWIDEGASIVQVTAIVYGKRNQVEQLTDMNME